MAKSESKIVRLRNAASGAIVSTTEENAARLPGAWEPATTKPAKKAAEKK